MNFFIPLIIIIISLVFMVIIVIRKFPTLASIDIGNLPSEKESRLKRNLLSERLRRKLIDRWQKIRIFVIPVWRVGRNGLISFYKKIRDLEKQYRLHKKRGHLPDSPNEAAADILTEAENYFSSGKLKEAEEAYIALIKHNPSHLEAYEGLVEVYLAQKEYEHAQETINFILRIKKDPSLVTAKKDDDELVNVSAADQHELAAHNFELGEIYLKNSEKEKALRSFKEAVKLDGNNPKYLDSLVEVSILVGNKLLAEKTLVRLKEVNPENSKIREWQRRINSI